MRSSLVRQIVQLSVIVMVIALLLFWQSDKPSVYAPGESPMRARALWVPRGDWIETRSVVFYEEGVIGPRRLKGSFMSEPIQIFNEGLTRINTDVNGSGPNPVILQTPRHQALSQIRWSSWRIFGPRSTW